MSDATFVVQVIVAPVEVTDETEMSEIVGWEVEDAVREILNAFEVTCIDEEESLT